MSLDVLMRDGDRDAGFFGDFRSTEVEGCVSRISAVWAAGPLAEAGRAGDCDFFFGALEPFPAGTFLFALCVRDFSLAARERAFSFLDMALSDVNVRFPGDFLRRFFGAVSPDFAVGGAVLRTLFFGIFFFVLSPPSLASALFGRPLILRLFGDEPCATLNFWACFLEGFDGGWTWRDTNICKRTCLHDRVGVDLKKLRLTLASQIVHNNDANTCMKWHNNTFNQQNDFQPTRGSTPQSSTHRSLRCSLSGLRVSGGSRALFLLLDQRSSTGATTSGGRGGGSGGTRSIYQWHKLWRGIKRCHDDGVRRRTHRAHVNRSRRHSGVRAARWTRRSGVEWRHFDVNDSCRACW